MSIIISKGGQDSERIDKSDFDKEDYLQNYIHQNPEAIPVYEIEEDKRLFVVTREFPTFSGPIDALAVDKDGDIYIVETKLYKNPDKRTVVAQALDYGASLWKHANDFSEFLRALDEETQEKHNCLFSEKVSDFFNIDMEQVNILLDNMKRNLQDGNLKFVILMDSMEERLKDLIIYVNQNSQFDIFAVELEYYKFKEYEIMIPKMFGIEVKKNISSGTASPRRNWTPEEFISDAKKRLNQAEFVGFKKLFDFSKNNAKDLGLGTGSAIGSINPVFSEYNSTNSFLCLRSNGRLGFKIVYTMRADKGANEDQIRKLNNLKSGLKNLGLEISDEEFSIYMTPDQWMDKVDAIIAEIKNNLA